MAFLAAEPLQPAEERKHPLWVVDDDNIPPTIWNCVLESIGAQESEHLQQRAELIKIESGSMK